jgi:hypothetical protein
MPGGFTPHTGTSTPPNKLWIGFIPDRYTMALPVRGLGQTNNLQLNGAGTNTYGTVQPQPCQYPGQFNTRNASVGGFITAPDGTTNTAQKLVEDGTSNDHYLQCGFTAYGFGRLPNVRMAMIWSTNGNTSGRTRIAYRLIGGGQFFNNVICGFDIAGGQIAYGPTYGGSGNTLWTVSNQTIINLGGGFYLCYIDILQLTDDYWEFNFVLDSGSGTASPNLVYNGNSSSGLFGWKSSIMPRTAWAISGYTFNDDFNDPTLANFDLTNAQQPGKDWYLQPGCYPGFYPAVVTPANKLSASGSILTIAPIAGTSTQEGGGVSTFCQPGQLQSPNHTTPGVGVGKGFKPPFLCEFSWAYDYPGSTGGGDASLWLISMEFMNRVSLFATPGAVVAVNNDINYVELDPIETQPTNAPYFGPTTSGGFGGAVIGQGWPSTNFGVMQNGGDLSSFYGMPTYLHSFWSGAGGAYPPGSCVSDLGAFYYQATNTNIGTDPPNNPPWVLTTYPGSNVRPTYSPFFIIDFTQQQQYAYMVLPYDPNTGDMGCALSFHAGAFKTVAYKWFPNGIQASGASPNPYLHTIDHQHFIIQLNFTGGVSQSGFAMYFDYVRMAQ